MDALAALESVQPPAPPGAGAFQLSRCGAAHAPDSDGWAALMEGTHAELNAAAARAAEARAAARALSDPEAAPEAEGHGEAWLRRGDEVEVAGDDINACTPLLKLSPEMAREEYLLNGQEGLDDLLAALDGGFEVCGGARGCSCCWQEEAQMSSRGGIVASLVVQLHMALAAQRTS